MAETTKVYLPKQHVARGVAGYKGKDVVVVDPKTNKQASAAEDAKANKVVAAENKAKANEAK